METVKLVRSYELYSYHYGENKLKRAYGQLGKLINAGRKQIKGSQTASEIELATYLHTGVHMRRG